MVTYNGAHWVPASLDLGVVGHCELLPVTPSLGHILGHHCGIQWSKDILKVIASIRVVDPVCEQWPEKSLVVKCQISELNVVWSPLLVPSMDNGQKYSLVQLCVTDTGIDQAGLCDKVIGPTLFK